MKLPLAIKLITRGILPLSVVQQEGSGSKPAPPPPPLPGVSAVNSAKKQSVRSLSPVPPTSSKKQKIKTPALLQPKKVTELRNCIAAMIYSEIKTGLEDLSKKMQQDLMFKKYHGFAHPGSGTDNRTDELPFEENRQTEKVPAYVQFLEGKSYYDMFWEVVDDVDVGGTALKLKSDLTNDHFSSVIAHRNLTCKQLATKDASSGILISGRALLDAANNTLRECKKMQSLIPLALDSKIIEKAGTMEGAEKKTICIYTFHSGKTIANFKEFILFEINNWDIFYGSTDLANTDMQGTIEPEATNETSESDHRVQHQESFQDESKEESNEAEGELIEPHPLGEDGELADVEQYDDEEQNDAVNDGDIYSMHLANGEYPSSGYCPRGYMAFMAWGPLGVTYSSVNKQLRSLSQDDNEEGGSRKEMKKAKQKAKAENRDFEAGIGIQRGMSLGAENQKEVAIIVQRQMQIQQSARDSEMIRLTKLIDSQNQTLQTHLQMAQLMHTVGDDTKFKDALAQYESVTKELAQNQSDLKALKNDVNGEMPEEVSVFLQRSRSSMGIGGNDKEDAN